MPNRPSTLHLLILSPIIALAFTYTGVEAGLIESLSHPVFLINFFITLFEVSLLFFLIYYLHFHYGLHWIVCLGLSLLAFFGIEWLMQAILDYEPEDYVEQVSSTLPFGSMIIITMNIIYSFIRRQNSMSEKIKRMQEIKEHSIWVKTLKGQQGLIPSQVLCAINKEGYVLIITKDEQIKGFISLKQLQQSLLPEEDYFKLNKQTIAHRSYVEAHESLKDGRIQVSLKDGNTTLISKNRASSFRNWNNE